jgi:energy-coupling factor transport system permease protein
MRSPIAYRPSRSALGGASAAAATAYFGSLALTCFVFESPIVLAGAGCAVLVAGLAAGATPALAAAARWGLTLAVLVIAVNAVASQRGDTILIRGFDLWPFGQIDVSLEAVVEGAVLGLRIAVVIAAFAVHCACVDPDRLMRLVRPLARHSALTATLIARLVPLAAADYARLSEAVALRGPAAAPVGRAAIARRLVAGSLDRAVDVAAALELRGYARGLPRGGRDTDPRRSRHSWRFAAAGIAIAALAVAAKLAGVGSFEPYPSIEIDADPATLAFAAALPLCAWLPFAGTGGERRG